ncbi:MAG: hypothetical protein HYT62_02595 [Candidatus Yanofskybacteria bacterium]|nr:hypothetical protein [Candidatus Yanofskybacteria bacterium]
MTLLELADVVIDARGGYKFIVVRVSDGVNNKLVIRANENCGYHRDILGLLRREAPDFRMSCVGGGRINIDPANKRIDIWSSSGDFGVEPDRRNTAEMLRIAFPDFEITIGSSR